MPDPAHARTLFSWAHPGVRAAAGSAVVGVAPVAGIACGLIEGDALAAGAVIGGVGLVVAALALVTGRGGPRRVEVGDAGLRWVDEGGQAHAAGWDCVRGVFLRRQVDDHGRVVTDTVRVAFDGGSQLTADARLSGYDRLRADVERLGETTGLVRRRSELAATGAARFGPVTVRHDGVTVRGAVTPWAEVERWAVTDDAVSVHTPHGVKVAPAADVPDVRVLARLLGEFAGAA